MAGSPLQLLNSPPTTSIAPSSGATGGVLSNSITQGTGTFMVGGSSVTTPLIIAAVVLGVFYFLRKK